MGVMLYHIITVELFNPLNDWSTSAVIMYVLSVISIIGLQFLGIFSILPTIHIFCTGDAPSSGRPLFARILTKLGVSAKLTKRVISINKSLEEGQYYAYTSGGALIVR